MTDTTSAPPMSYGASLHAFIDAQCEERKIGIARRDVIHDIVTQFNTEWKSRQPAKTAQDSSKIPWGKMKGESVKDACVKDPKYVRWMLSSSYCNEATKKEINLYLIPEEDDYSDAE